jgi:hypothetical protein
MRLTLGLRPLDLSGWLDIENDVDAMLAHKRRLLRSHHDEAVAVTPQGRAGSAETLELVVDWLRQHAPGRTPDADPSLHPVDAAGRLVAEDICVLSRDAAWRLTAASVCSPSRWRLREKIGRTVAEIHAPVPEYAGWYSDAVDASLDRVSIERPVWRLNWTILENPALFQQHGAPVGSGDVRLETLTFRVERQTLRRLPRTGDLVFTILTNQTSLAEVCADPARSDALVRTLRTCPPDLADYKGWSAALSRVIERLEQVGRLVS